MVANSYEWWTDDKVNTTVTKQFIYSHLRADEAERLTDPVFADLSDSNYLECILERARRLFLILIHLGVPGDILRLIEDSYDDDNLPIDEDDVTSLRLSRVRGQQIDHQFYRSQFKYLTRVVGEGEHIRYAQAESVPIHRVEQKMIPSPNALERVSLPSPVNRVLLLKRMYLDEDRAEIDILTEIAATKSQTHEHVLSVYGSYVQDGYMHILMTPAAKYSLAAFLSDRPKAFEALPKPERRSHYVMWPHCLANALAWLHDHGTYHGAVRPSRIFIDEQYQISLGQFEGDQVLGALTPTGDLESYSYAAPEFWKRGLTVQAQGSSATVTHGGRSAVGRRDVSHLVEESQRRSHENEQTREKAFALAGETTYTFVPKFKGVSSRLKLELSAHPSSPPMNQLGRSESRFNERVDSPIDFIRRNHSLYRRYGPTSVKSSSSSENDRSSAANRSERMYSIASETKSTAVQTWRSTANNFPATDVFGLAAVTMDMLTVMCSRTVSAFAKHRASKNRQAGRGGGLADSSFHANLPAVGTWAEILHKDAEKKLKKNSGEIFRIVGPILQIVTQCLEREPQKRASASALSRRLDRHLADFAGVHQLHCSPPKADDHALRSQSVATVAPGIVEMPHRDKQSRNGRQFRGDTIQELPESPPDHLGDDSRTSERSTGPYTPSESRVTSGSYHQSMSTTDPDVHSTQTDPYDYYDDDIKAGESYYVQVTPKERNMLRRLHRDYTEHDLPSRATSVAPSFTTATTSLRYDTSRHPKVPEISYSASPRYDSYSHYPPASPPPMRQLPPSPPDQARMKYGRSVRSSTAPLDNVQEANDLLAAVRDMTLEDRLSYASSMSPHVYLNVDEGDDDWRLHK